MEELYALAILKPLDRSACLYTVPGTEYDMDVDVYDGTIEELRKKWPLNGSMSSVGSPTVREGKFR